MKPKTYALDDLSSLTGLSRRTIRYYIQIGLVSRPEGEGRGAHYVERHLNELLSVKNLASQGLSLEAIRRLAEGKPEARESRSQPIIGQTAVRSHVWLSPGLELVVDPQKSTLNAQGLNYLVNEIIKVAQNFQDSLDNRPKERAKGRKALSGQHEGDQAEEGQAEEGQTEEGQAVGPEGRPGKGDWERRKNEGGGKP
ncbi:MAG: helix-turn-helix domain-containing protein [Deltaproteobacteria bacterium]|jgi:DNA-binding transcriptional MerR regulator|nr:helix-turn-helix domain-containing protein [Deltaproteobacteria bacterium]